MAQTSRGIVYPEPADFATPLDGHFKSLADSADTAIGKGVAFENIDFGLEDSVSSFPISVAAGAYEQLRLVLRGSLTAIGFVEIRINDDSTASMHRSGLLVWGADGTLAFSNHADVAVWTLAEWGTADGCTAIAVLDATDIEARVAFLSEGVRHNATDSAHRLSKGFGRLNETRLVSSLSVRTSETFSPCRWRLDGIPAREA